MHTDCPKCATYVSAPNGQFRIEPIAAYAGGLLKHMTPFESFYDRKPDLSHLREIGSRAFVLILNVHNPKIYQRSEECVLIGYGKDSKTYRCYHRATQKVYESFHVVFIESKDDIDRPFRPGFTSFLPGDDDSSTFEPSPPTDAAAPAAPQVTASTVPPVVIPPPAPSIAVHAPPNLPVLARRSSRIPTPTVRLSEAQGIQRISAVQRATEESKAAGARVRSARSREPSARPDSQGSSIPKPINAADLAELLGDVPREILDCMVASGEIDAEFPDDPASFQEAMASPDADKWLAACKEELASIMALDVYDLVPRNEASEAGGRRIMKGKFVFRVKRDEHGAAIRWKVRFVAKGYEAVYGVDYKKTTSPTMRLETFRIIAHISAAMGWSLHQVDIKTAFLRGLLPKGEEVFMEQPTGFAVKGKEGWIWKVKRGLYGLPNGGRVWNQTMNDAMLRFGYKRVTCEHCLYLRVSASGTVLTGVHVDDFLATVSNDNEAIRFKSDLKRVWEISDLGIAKFCVGIAIERDLANKHIFLSQTALIDRVLATFKMTDSNAVSTPMEAGLILSRTPSHPPTPAEAAELLAFPYRKLVGLLMYIAIGTRPDIALAVQKLSQYLDGFTLDHWAAAKRVLRYLKGTRTLRLRLGGASIDIVGFTDASYACCPDTRRSVAAYCFSLGESGMVSWCARKQKTVAQSTCDAEYMAAAEAAREAMWLRMLLEEIGFKSNRPTPLLCDNEAARVLSEDATFHSRAKHIDVRYHYIRDCTQSNHILVHHVPSEDNVADILTKPLSPAVFLRLRGFLGLCDFP